MTIPAITVEVAFSSTPLSTSPTWTDITAYVRHAPGISIGRGRSNEASSFSAGRLSLTLDNRDRRFDPLNSAGPHFGNLTPRKQIRVQATWQGSTFTLYRGFVAGWPTAYPRKGRDAVVNIDAFDGLALLSDTPMPDQVFQYVDASIGDLGAFYRQLVDSTWVDAKSGQNLGLSSGTANAGRSGLADVVGPSTPLFFDGSTSYRRPGFVSYGGDTLSLGGSISFLMQTTGAGASASDWMSILGHDEGGGRYLRIGIDSSGKLRVHYRQSTLSLSEYVSSAIAVNDGRPHHIVIVGGNLSGGVPQVYVDGINWTTDYSAPGGSILWVHRISFVGSAVDSTSDTDFVGDLQDVALIGKDLTATEVAFLYLAYAGARPEVASARLASVLNSVGWPSAWRQWSTYLTSVADVWRTNGTTALAQLQALGDTEQGRLFADRNNDITLQARHHASTDAIGSAVRVALADDRTAVPFVEFDGFDPGDRDVTNTATVSARYGSATSSDSASITANGQRSRSASTLVRSVDEAKSIADGLVYLGKTPRSRAMPVTVSMAEASTWSTTVGDAVVGAALVGGRTVVDAMLGIDVGYRYRIKMTPSGVGSALTQDLHVESLDWFITATEMELRMVGAPAPSQPWVVVGTSTVGAVDVVGY